jgi:hypothetical protein
MLWPPLVPNLLHYNLLDSYIPCWAFHILLCGTTALSLSFMWKYADAACMLRSPLWSNY